MVSSNEKRIYKNTIALMLRTLLTIPIGFISVRLAFKYLGASDYGMVGLLSGLLSIVVVITLNISSATKRYLCYEMSQNNEERLSRLFSTIFYLYAIIGVVLLICFEFFGCWMILHKIDILPENIPSAIGFYQTVLLAFLIQFIGGVYASVLIAYEDIKTTAWILFLESISHFVLLLVLFLLPKFKPLFLYGFTNVIAYAITALMYYYIAHKRYGKIVKLQRIIDKGFLKEISNFSFWLVANGVSHSLYNFFTGVVLNNYFTSIANAAQGIATIVNGKIVGFGQGLMSASQPQLIKLYAQNRIQELESLFVRITKGGYFILLLVGLPVIINIDFLLKAWLGIPPDYCKEFVLCGYIAALVQVMISPGNTMIQATGNVRTFQIVMGLVPWVMFAVVCYGIKYGVLWIPIISCITSILTNVIRLFFIKRYIPDIRILHVLSEITKRVFLIIVPSVGIIVIYNLFVTNHSWLSVIGSSILEFLFVGILIWLVGLTSEERNAVSLMARDKLRRVLG